MIPRRRSRATDGSHTTEDAKGRAFSTFRIQSTKPVQLMTTDNELCDVLRHHDELETQVQALRQRMLPLLLEAYPEVATALELIFESDIGAKCNYMFAGKAEGGAVRLIDACLAAVRITSTSG